MYNSKSAKASLRGAMNRAEGEMFEKLIQASCEHYRAQGIAYIEKTPEPFKIIRSLGKGLFTGCFEKQAQPDFKGTLQHGLSIVFDAKMTSTDKLQLSVLSDEQERSLKTHRELGAATYILMGYNFKSFYLMPFELFISAKEINGHKYWTSEEAKKMTKPLNYNGSMLYFLQNILDNWG